METARPIMFLEKRATIPPHVPHSPWKNIPRDLTRRSNQWALIADLMPNGNLARNIRSGLVKDFLDAEESNWGRFDAKALRDIWGTYSIYARFISGEVR